MSEEERYRLAPVRDARERDEKIRRGDLSAAVGDARASEAVLARLAARVDEAGARVTAALAARDASTTAGERARAERYVARRRHELADANVEHDRAAAAHAASSSAVDVARTTLARARAEREVIERHFARWREAKHKRAERRADD